MADPSFVGDPLMFRIPSDELGAAPLYAAIIMILRKLPPSSPPKKSKARGRVRERHLIKQAQN